MPMIRPCPRCGAKRLVSGKNAAARICLACFKAEGCTGGRMKRKPNMDQQLVTFTAADRASQCPSSSWWAVSSREEFGKNFQAELPRLMAIGANIPRSQQRSVESDF